MAKKKIEYKAPTEDELEYYIGSEGLTLATQRFCGSSSTRARLFIRQLCEDYHIELPAVSVKCTVEVDRPSKENVIKIARSYATQREMAAELGVGIPTLRKWLKYYNVR